MPRDRPVVAYEAREGRPVVAPPCPKCQSQETVPARRGPLARFVVGFLVIMPVVVCVLGVWIGALLLIWLLLLPISVPLLFSPGPKCRCSSCGYRWLPAYEHG